MSIDLSTSRRLRVLLAADGAAGSYDSGTSFAAAERVGRALRDAGHEVVFVGEVPSPEVLAAVAEQEDVDATVLCAGDALRVEADDDAVREALAAYASK
jgi:methylmalonyl-CoA mutase cobalamin-binding subunit